MGLRIPCGFRIRQVPSSVIASGASDLNSVHWHPDGFHTVRSSEDVVHGASSYGFLEHSIWSMASKLRAMAS